MRDSETCPKCHSRKIYVVQEVGNGHAEYSQTVPLPVAIVALPPAGEGMFGGAGRVVQAGRFEAWVCAKCGLTELYATKLDEVARLAERSAGVRVIEHEADPASPYRR